MKCDRDGCWEQGRYRPQSVDHTAPSVLLCKHCTELLAVALRTEGYHCVVLDIETGELFHVDPEDAS